MDMNHYKIETVAISVDGQRVLINKHEFDESKHDAWELETALDVSSEEQEETGADGATGAEASPAPKRRGRPPVAK